MAERYPSRRLVPYCLSRKFGGVGDVAFFSISHEQTQLNLSLIHLLLVLFPYFYRISVFRIYYRKQLGVLSIVLESCKHASMNCRTIAINLAGQPNVIIFQSPSRLTVSKALPLSTKVMLRFIFCF